MLQASNGEIVTNDHYIGTFLSEKSLNKLMKKSIGKADEFLDLGLELDFNQYEIDEFLNACDNNYAMAGYKLVLKWRDVTSAATKEGKLKCFHDAFVEINKHGALCPDGSCQYTTLQNGIA